MATLSVIIPVYKVEDYLERCVQSVLEQDYKDFEIILVDDGSPDKCPQICDNLASQDSRVIVIHKKNGGLSSARNEGIRVASGEYVVFLDSDDQWVVNKLKPLMEQALLTNAQMIYFSSMCLYEGVGCYIRESHGFFNSGNEILSPLQIYPILIKYGDLHEHACTKIIKTDFLKGNDLFFKEGILGEDTEWQFRVLRKKVSICISNICLYIYTQGRSGSIVNTASTRSVRDTLSTIQSSIDYYKQNPQAPTKEFELAHCSYLWSIVLGLYRKVIEKDRDEIKEDMKRIKKDLDLSAHPKSRIVGRLYKLLGFELSSLVLSWYIWLHRRNIVNAKKKVNG